MALASQRLKQAEERSVKLSPYFWLISIVLADESAGLPGKYFSQQNKVCSQFTVSDKNSFYDII